jgi:hypothetical protein
VTGKYTAKPGRFEGKQDIIEYVKSALGRLNEGDSSLQIGHTAIEDGDLTVRNGDILVSESDGTLVLRIMHGAVPEIRFFPLGATDTHRATILALDANVDPALLDQAIQIFVETTGGVIDGGKVLMTRNYAIFSHQPDASGGPETYLWLNADPGTPGVIQMRGIWSNQIQYDSGQALYMGSFTAGAGFSTWTHTYFSSFLTAMYPIVNVNYTGATLQWNLDGFNSSSFTVRFGTTAGSKVINFWNFRL